MARTRVEKKALIYQSMVTVAGLCTWLASVIFLFMRHSPREQLILVAFVPIIIVISTQQVIPGAGLAVTEEETVGEISFSRKELAAFYELVQALNAARGRDEL